MDENALKVLLAQGASVEEIGRRFDRDPSTVAYWMGKHGLQAVNREKYAAKGGISEERLAGLVACGSTIAEIAEAVALSKGTVRHWLRHYGLRTQGGVRAREAAEAREAGIANIKRECRVHGLADFVLEGRGFYRCKRCRLERVAERRRNVKRILVREAGGECVGCGYHRYIGALQFHHLDPRLKRMEINCSGATLSLDAMRLEATKCILLCSNCHAEVENGLRTLALK